MVLAGLRLPAARERLGVSLHIGGGIDAHVVEALAQKFVHPQREGFVVRHVRHGHLPHERLLVEGHARDRHPVGHRVVLEPLTEVPGFEELVNGLRVPPFNEHRAGPSTQQPLDGWLPCGLVGVHVDEFADERQVGEGEPQLMGD